MKSPMDKYQLPGILKLGVYFGEVAILSLLYYLAYAVKFVKYNDSVEHLFNSWFGYLLMALIVAYCIGVLCRPITFYYRSSRRGSIVTNVATAVAIQAMVFLMFTILVDKTVLIGTKRLVVYFICFFVSLMLWRLFCRKLIRLLRSAGRNSHQVVFVGVSDTLSELCLEMENPDYGYYVVGYFNDEKVDSVPEHLEYLGKVDEVVDFLNSRNNVHQLYCGLPAARGEEIREIIDTCENTCVRFYSVPEVRTYLKRTMQLELLGSVPVLSMREDPLLSLYNRFIKRVFDIIVAGLFMIPFWLLIYPIVALCTKIFQPGPVFFKQNRNGLNGEIFQCIKFRSMKVNADSDKVQATKDDPRKTPFGNFLRKSSIDELPQFINVLKGDMSIVGPRPHMVMHTEEYSKLINKYMVRHWVRPGITGWAQVNGARGETKELWQMEDRIKKDIWYIENWSLSLDIKIMFLTVWNAVRGDKQAY